MEPDAIATQLADALEKIAALERRVAALEAHNERISEVARTVQADLAAIDRRRGQRESGRT